MMMVPQLRDQFIPLCHLVCEESYDGALRQSAAMLCELFNARDCVLLLLDGTGQDFVVALGVRKGDTHWAPQQLTLNIEADRKSGGPFAQVALTGNALSGLDQSCGYPTDFIQDLLGIGFENVLILPLKRLQGGLLGVALISGAKTDVSTLVETHDLTFLVNAIGGVIHRKVLELSRLRERQDLQNSLDHMDRDREDLRGKLSGVLLEKIPGRSEAVRNLRAKISRLANFEGNITIFGPEGCGQETIAQEIHNASRRARSPFVYVNCKDLTEDNFASLLLGHKRGAIQGVSAARKGYIREAGEGMVYFERVDLLPLELQSTLVRVLEKRTYRTLGSEREIPVAARFVFSASADLPERRKESEFLGSLFFKITQSSLQAPPLASRPEDIPDLATAIVRRLSRKLRKPCSLSEETSLLLKSEAIVGDVKEIESRLERAIMRVDAQGGEVFPEHLAEDFGEEMQACRDRSLPDRLASYERGLLLAALKEHDFDRSLAAETLKIPKRTLADKCKKYQI